MTAYYRTSDGAILQLDPALVLALAPVKRATLKLYAVAAEPIIPAGKRLAVGPVQVVGDFATQTWLLVDKTAAELAAEAYAAERALEYQQVRTVFQALKAGTGTTVERVRRVELILVRMMKDIFGGEPA